MPSATASLLSRYHYDPLDRLAGQLRAGQPGQRRFYQNNRLATEVQGPVWCSWLQTAQCLLAQQRFEAQQLDYSLIATDTQGSVLLGGSGKREQAFAYTPYGNRQPVVDPLHLPGFNRELSDPLTGHYLLGNGYRAFNPVLMRFNSPDRLSPFGKDGLNAYAYCSGDPVNRVDRDGRMPLRATGKAIQPRSILKPVQPSEEPSVDAGAQQGIYALRERWNRAQEDWNEGAGGLDQAGRRKLQRAMDKALQDYRARHDARWLERESLRVAANLQWNSLADRQRAATTVKIIASSSIPESVMRLLEPPPDYPGAGTVGLGFPEPDYPGAGVADYPALPPRDYPPADKQASIRRQ